MNHMNQGLLFNKYQLICSQDQNLLLHKSYFIL